MLATLIYLLAGVIILEVANVIDLVASEFPCNAVWVLAGFFGLGVLINSISRSPKERRMALVALLLSALCVVVGVSL